MGYSSKKLRSKVIYSCYLLVVLVLSLEILLRIYYPFQRKIRGDKWKLSTNIVYHFHNDNNLRLDRDIINRRNNLGFRGENVPANISSRFSILTVGGSTTACSYLTEGKTWTDSLGYHLKKQFPSLWINNAGIDGHSTFGHLNFLYYYLPSLPVKPAVIIFLIGANDIDRNDLTVIDSSLNSGLLASTRSWLENHSETVNFFVDLKWAIHPVDIFKDDPNWNFTHFKTVHLSQSYTDSALQGQQKLLTGFSKRLRLLADVCRKDSIEPIFVTQPSVFGDGTTEGGNPAIDFHLHRKENGQLFWKKLALFNNVTKSVSAEKKVHCIDLGSLLPKDTLYFYDLIHFTNAGSAKVSELLFDDLNSYLAKQFTQYLKR